MPLDPQFLSRRPHSNEHHVGLCRLDCLKHGGSSRGIVQVTVVRADDLETRVALGQDLGCSCGNPVIAG